MDANPYRHRDPDLEFDAYLTRADAKVLCDCRIWFPQDASEDAHIEIELPPSTESAIYFGPTAITIVGSPSKNRDVLMSGVWVAEGPARHSRPRLAARRNIRLGWVERLIDRVQFERSAEASGEGPKVTLTFGLTDCKYLTPLAWIESSFTGDVTVDAGQRLEAKHPRLGTLLFDKHYRSYTRSDMKGRITTSHLVASVQDPPLQLLDSLDAVELQMDDVCLLISLAARKRVLVIEMKCSKPDEASIVWMGPLKRHRPPEREWFEGELIPPTAFSDYFEVAAETFDSLGEPDKQRVREGIYPLVPAFPAGAVESQFVALFSALEGLIRFRSVEPATVVDGARWRTAKAAIKKCISSLGPEFSPEDKEAFRQKVGELNRPAVKTATTKFLKKYEIQAEDLWPIFGSPGSVGLAEIRNSLAHGDIPSEEASVALNVAKSHLTLLLERCLLSVLGFPVARSYARVSAARELGRGWNVEQLQRTFQKS
jgi:hypothetical protein